MNEDATILIVEDDPSILAGLSKTLAQAGYSVSSASNGQEALAIYRIYLMRSKIEEVFKFVKNAVGWEEFQVRDWESIKNLIATAFFIGGYFYQLEPQLSQHPAIEWLCQLGNGKGKVTRHFFLEGLRNLLIHRHVERMREQSDLTDFEWEEILSFAL